MKTIKRTIIILLAVLIAGYLVNLVLQKRYYQTISQETLIGIIRCAKSTDKNYDYYLFYLPARPNGRSGGPATKGEQPSFRFVKLKGDEWFFEGEIIKWKGLLNLLGFKTVQRPVRIYDSAGTSYLLEAGPQKIVFGIEKILPVIDTSFTSIVKQRFMPKIKIGIYATNSGYLVRRVR